MSEASTRPLWRDLYEEAFRRYKAVALWSYRQLENPNGTHALEVARALRQAGGMPARRFAEKIESAVRAAE